jgi:hypothetical protein
LVGQSLEEVVDRVAVGLAAVTATSSMSLESGSMDRCVL